MKICKDVKVVVAAEVEKHNKIIHDNREYDIVDIKRDMDEVIKFYTISFRLKGKIEHKQFNFKPNDEVLIK